MSKIIICPDCPCRPENVELCVKAGYKNAQEFGEKLAKEIRNAKKLKIIHEKQSQ